MNLVKLIDEIKKIQPFVKEDTEGGNPATLSARRGRKRQAIDQMKVLTRQYRDELIRSVTFLVVTGSEQKAFVDLATNKEVGNCFVADPNKVFTDLAEKIDPQIYSGKSTNASMFEIVGRLLENKALDLDIVGYPQMIFKQQYVRNLNNKDDLVALIKQGISEQVGAELVGIQAAQSIVDLAIESGYKGTTRPLVLGTDDPKFALDLFDSLPRLSPRVTIVVAGKGTKLLKSITSPNSFSVSEPNEESVKETLKKIKNAGKR